MDDLDKQIVAARTHRELRLLEELVEDFLNKHSLLGGDDIEIWCIIAPNGIDRTYQVREKK